MVFKNSLLSAKKITSMSKCCDIVQFDEYQNKVITWLGYQEFC